MSGDNAFFMTAPEEPDIKEYIDCGLIAGRITLEKFAAMTYEEFENIDIEGNISQCHFCSVQEEVRTFLYMAGDF
jgi:hypothetical protein